MTDTHCHLTFPQYDADPAAPTGLPPSPKGLRHSTPSSWPGGGTSRGAGPTSPKLRGAGPTSLKLRGAGREAVLRRAKEVGVTRIINPGTDLMQSLAAVALAREFPATVRAGVGVHPHDVTELTESVWGEIAELARAPEVVAVGEVGLERSARSPALEIQLRWLTRFISLAQTAEKPCIFHVRDAHREFREFLERAWGPALPPHAARSAGQTRRLARGEVGPAPPKLRKERRGVVHCFSGTLEDAQWYIARGLFLGITGIVTFPNAGALQRIVREVPLASILLETDAPFLAPQSVRGKRNEPAFVREIAVKVAELKELSIDDVVRVTDENAVSLFSGATLP